MMTGILLFLHVSLHTHHHASNEIEVELLRENNPIEISHCKTKEADMVQPLFASILLFLNF